MNGKMIPFDSPAAASLKTVTGWVSSTGNFWGADEHMARYDGCTHRKCEDCGILIPVRGLLVCDACAEKRAVSRYATMPTMEWDRKSMLYSEVSDRWFANAEELRDYCDDNNTWPSTMRLILAQPVFAKEIDPTEHYCDDIPDGGDLPAAIEDAFDRLNEAIRACREPVSWELTKYAASYASTNIMVEKFWFCGLEVVSHPLIKPVPKIQLSPDVLMTENFRAEMNAWLKEKFGMKETALRTNDTIYVSREVFKKLRAEFRGTAKEPNLQYGRTRV